MAGQIDVSMNSSVPVCQSKLNDFRNSTNSMQSPLQLFVKAKKKINEHFLEMHDYIEESRNFIDSLHKEVISENAVQEVNQFCERIKAIQDVLRRDHMKVVFFGRTSNGKSTVINALLGDRILPTGIGHTTACFLQVEGGDTNEAYLTTAECPGEHRNVESVSQLAHALCSDKVDVESLIKIVWPKERCMMLGEEVVIMDSPGIDVEADLDEWIDKFCLDSDVFVLVANSESTLMLSEKRFFHKVSERLSKPNIFIVHNRSDAFAGESMAQQAREQHSERAVKFLVEELRVSEKRDDAEGRIYFISAKEALQARIQEAHNQPLNIKTEEFFSRYLEFQRFEKQFSSCLSRSAVTTKFSAHSQRGRNIMQSMAAILARVNGIALAQESIYAEQKRELTERCNYINEKLKLLTTEMRDKIRSITEDVEHKVCKCMSEEIRRLNDLVDEFSDPFNSDPMVLNVYKSKLNRHVEQGVGSNMKARLSNELQLNIESHQEEMIQLMTSLLPHEQQLMSHKILPRREAFEVLYHLNCEHLCSDFEEDIQFRFSFGLSALVTRFIGSGLIKSEPGLIVPSKVSRNKKSNHVKGSLGFVSDEWSLLSKIAVASLTSQGTMGGLLIGGFLFKTVGWRAIFASCALYGTLYCYERLTWTNAAKCKEFKRQFVDHAANKLRLIVDMTSANCSHQVQQELSSTFGRLCNLVDESTLGIKEDMKSIDVRIHQLQDDATKSKILRNQATFIHNKMEDFETKYIKYN